VVIALAFHLVRSEFKTRLRLQLMKLSGFTRLSWCNYQCWLGKVSGWARRCFAGPGLVPSAGWGPCKTPSSVGSVVPWYVCIQYVNSNKKKTKADF